MTHTMVYLGKWDIGTSVSAGQAGCVVQAFSRLTKFLSTGSINYVFLIKSIQCHYFLILWNAVKYIN